MANDKQKPETIELSGYRIVPLGGGRYDVVEESVRGIATRKKTWEKNVSLPVARERWDRLKNAQAASDQGRI